MKVADIAPGSYALLQLPEGGAISGVFRLPSGRGWWCSPSEGERFPKTEHLGAPDAHKRGDGWEWGPSEKYMVDLVAAGLTAEDFASAEALAGALRAKARPSRRPAPTWATGSGGALLALPDKRIALWWGVDDGGKRWAIVDCPSDREVEPLRRREPSPWADGPTSSAGPLDGARVVAGDLPAETVRALALLRPATEEAAQRAADMLSRARGGRPRGCALLIGRDAIGVMWADGAYGFAQAKPAEFTIAEWKVGRDFVDVAIDDLTEAQAVALWRKVGDSRADALEAARLRLRLGVSMDRSPPRGHEWTQARGHVRVELCRSPLGTMEVFGGADAPAGTLLYGGATPGKGDQGDVWLRSAAGWALVSAQEDGNGWPGDERRAPRDSRREMQVLARDLSPEAQAGLLLRARRARDEGARLSRFTLDKLCEALDAAVAAASARGTALAQLRGRLLADQIGRAHV